MNVGQNIQTSIEKAIEHECQYFVLVIDDHNLQSDWVRHEIDQIKKFEKEKQKTVLIPLFLSETTWKAAAPLVGETRKVIRCFDLRDDTIRDAAHQFTGSLLGWLVADVDKPGPVKPIQTPDVRQPTSHVVATEFDGEALTLLPNPPSERNELAAVFNLARREANRLVRHGNLANIAPSLHEAVSDYVHAMPDRFEDLDAICLCLGGEILRLRYEAAKEELQQHFPDRKGQLDGFLLAHDMLARRLPNWQNFLAEEAELGENVDEATAEEVGRDADRIIEEWEKAPDVIDEAIPRVVRMYRQFRHSPGETAEQTTFALIRAIEDVVIAPLQFALDLVKDTGAATRPRLSKTLSVIFTAGVVGAIMHFAGLYPAVFGWVRQGLEFLKQFGLLTLG